MFLQDKRNEDMVEVCDIAQLFDPNQEAVTGRYHAGEEMPETQTFLKSDLCFPSGEPLPRCWLDVGWKG